MNISKWIIQQLKFDAFYRWVLRRWHLLALWFFKRAVYFCKRALDFHQRPLYLRKRALYFRKEPYISAWAMDITGECCGAGVGVALRFCKRTVYFWKRALYFRHRTLYFRVGNAYYRWVLRRWRRRYREDAGRAPDSFVCVVYEEETRKAGVKGK